MRNYLCALDERNFAVPVDLLRRLLRPCGRAVDDGVNAHQGRWQARRVVQIRLHCGCSPVPQKICRVLPRPHNTPHLRQMFFNIYMMSILYFLSCIILDTQQLQVFVQPGKCFTSCVRLHFGAVS